MKISQLSHLLAVVTLFSAAASAGPLTVTPGVWQTEPFTQMNPGDFFPNAYQAAAPETIALTGYYVTGDYYGIYVNGTLAHTSTQVMPTDINYGGAGQYADPASAYVSGLFSTAQFQVAAGDLITITDLYPPSGIGEVGIEAVATPEPASFALIALTALGAIALRLRHKEAC